MSTASPDVHDQPDGTTQLQQLAAALSLRGYEATVITPAPYLAIRAPSATLPQLIYNTGGQLWWHAAQIIAPTGQATIAAETITWALRAHAGQPPTEDTTSPLTPAPRAVDGENNPRKLGSPPPPTSTGGREC